MGRAGGFQAVLDSDDHATLVKKLKKVYSQDVQVLNRGTTSLLKFPLVPTRHPDGSAVTNEWLHKTISGHAKWQHVEFIQKPHFIIPTGKNVGFTATVFMEVSDDRAASTAKRLLQTDLGNAASACAGDIQPTTAPPSLPGAILALGIMSLVPTGPPSKPTPYSTPSNAPTASATTGLHPAYALSTGLASTLRSLLSSRRFDSIG
ncbi:hypothetical protein AX14_001042 [Amanita brunnescens Koide BX004]|nr:hypothetical protein AX14_001042 [Amanita brunnescens Koide BX004]